MSKRLGRDASAAECFIQEAGLVMPHPTIPLPPKVGRYRGKADIALVASRRRVYVYTA